MTAQHKGIENKFIKYLLCFSGFEPKTSLAEATEQAPMILDQWLNSSVIFPLYQWMIRRHHLKALMPRKSTNLIILCKDLEYR